MNQLFFKMKMKFNRLTPHKHIKCFPSMSNHLLSIVHQIASPLRLNMFTKSK